MNNSQIPRQTRHKALLLAGLMDMALGAALLLVWIGILPVDLSTCGIPHWVAGAVGASLFFPGIVLVTYQVTRTGPPE